MPTTTAEELVGAQWRIKWFIEDLMIPVRHAVSWWREGKTWAEADSLRDLCGLTERWLTGDLKSQPGYYGSVDVDEEYAPGLTDALIALNRAGFMTRNSQAALTEEQCVFGYPVEAWVVGYATPATTARLRQLLAGSEYQVATQSDPYQGQVEGWLTMRRRDIAFDLDGCSKDAVREATKADRVVIWDPALARNTMWADLSEVLP